MTFDFNSAVASARAAETERNSAHPEAELRAAWAKRNVPIGQQESMLAEIAAKAAPGAMAGPFRIGGAQLGMPGTEAVSPPGHTKPKRVQRSTDALPLFGAPK